MSTEQKPDIDSTFRPNQLYVTVDVHRALGYLAKATKKNRDEIASAVLAAWIARDYPKLAAYIKTRNDEDNKFRKQFESEVAPLPF